MSYLYTETENMAQFHTGLNCGSLNWQPCKAKTETAARRVAQSARTFQRTIVHIALVNSSGKIMPLAHRVGRIWQESKD